MRQVVLDTETTGLEPGLGHRIIEIGCVELLNRRLTGNHFHQYLQPDREIDAGAIEVHGISNEFLADKPRFEDIVPDFIEFIAGAELVIHNAPFDVAFINHELAMLGTRWNSLTEYCTVLDSLVLARKKHPGQRNSLDALCKRYGIDNSQRSLHGALLDAEILAEVYLTMTGGQGNLLLDREESGVPMDTDDDVQVSAAGHEPLKVIVASKEELTAHERVLDMIEQNSTEQCLWRQLESAVD